MESLAAIRWVLLYTLFLNLLVTGAKITVGYATGSLSIVADGFDSLFDAATNLLGLIAIYVSHRPPDEDHPYGHRRYEALITLFVSLLLFSTCYGILQGAYQRLRSPSVPEVNPWSFAALFFSIAVHMYTARYETRQGRKLKSEFLLADAAHTSADIFVTIGVIVGLIVVRLGYAWVDTLVAVLISLIIAKIGLDIVRQSTKILTDSTAVETTRIAAILDHTPGVESYHRIRSRGQDDDIRLDLHVRVAPDLPLTQAHAIGHLVQRRIADAIEGVRDVVVHVEPQPGGPSAAYGEISSKVKDIARDLGVPVHHINAIDIAGRYSIDLHVDVPEGLHLGTAHALASRLEEALRSRMPEVADVHTHIEPAPGALPECDEEASDSDREQAIRELVQTVPGVRACDELLFRRSGKQLFISVHCLADQTLPVVQAHDIATLVEERVRRVCPDVANVSVHVEPIACS